MRIQFMMGLLCSVLLVGTVFGDDHQLIKERYVRFLTGTDKTFTGKYGAAAADQFLKVIKRPIRNAMRHDFTKNADKTFHIFQHEPGFDEESKVYETLLEQYLLSLAYGYCVDAPDSPHYKNPKVLKCYIQCLEYLHSRGVRDGMTFHYSDKRMDRAEDAKPVDGAGNIVKMELRMGAYCQSVLLMEPYFKDTPTYPKARALVRHLEMLGTTSGHVRYYESYENPPEFEHRVQSDAIQNYSDTTLVSALLETDPARRGNMLREAQQVYTDSLKVIPGWADTIKPDFTGYHHRGIYGNAYTGGFIPQAAFGVYILNGTGYAVEKQSAENGKELIKTYRLYCQKYAMPFGIRGRMPDNMRQTALYLFPGTLIYASALGLDDADIKPIFARLWDADEVGLDFLFTGGRGKMFRGMYALDMLEQLEAEQIVPEPDPSGFWCKPYGGLAIHRRGNWMAAVKGYSKYIWDYENGDKLENVYGQYLSHGSLTIFSQGDPVNDIASGYDLNKGWDWYRMPGTTAVHFPIKPQKPLEHRQFSPETFLGGASADGKNGVFGMIIDQRKFGDGTKLSLKARKSYFFVDDFILMLGAGVSGGDGKHPVETTLFQSTLPGGSLSKSDLVDPAGNRYWLPDTTNLKLFSGMRESYRDDGKRPTSGNVAMAWIDHGLAPKKATYEVAIGVRGAEKKKYEVVRQDNRLHHVRFPDDKLAAYVFFQPLEIKDPIIGKADQPCLVMAQQTGSTLKLGVANPDLGLLPPDAETPTMKLISKNMNQYLASQPRPVEITLRGKWKLKKPVDKVKVVSTGVNKTILRFDCIHGMDIRVELQKN
ncbi:MAG: hypothetical protein K9M45_07905 [Kiritimatiellales bacterium]|nr:hypothetical protein [Kiritimatiellales bacterium]